MNNFPTKFSKVIKTYFCHFNMYQNKQFMSKIQHFGFY